MATIHAAPNLTPTQWDFNFYREYGKSNRFSRYMANNPNSIIHVREDLTTKPGKDIVFPLIRKLKGQGVSGSATLEGNEEDLDQRSAKVTVDWGRHAVKTNKAEEQLTGVNLREAMKWGLKEWINDRLIDKVILDGLLAIPTGNAQQVRYADAREAQKDTWLANNSDRVLFGKSMANNSGNDHSASLANCDTTNDLLSADVLDLAKYMAKVANPRIRPLRTERDEKFYVVFCGPKAMKNLRADSTIRSAQRDAMARSEDNPLFTGGDIVWNNLLVHEIEEIPTMAGVGASSADVEPFFLCGAQALCYGIGQRTQTVEEKKDYGFVSGLGIEILDGLVKTVFGKNDTSDQADPVQHGLLTGYVAVSV